MTESSRDEPSKKNKIGYAKKSASIVFFPVTLTGKSVFSSAKLFYKSARVTISQLSYLKKVGSNCVDNIKKSGIKKGNHNFDDVFSGPNRNELIFQNEKRFLLRKRITIAFLLTGVFYSIFNIVILNSFFGILTFFSTIVLSTAFCLEQTFRIWQLRNKRLSIEEEGGITSFLSEESVFSIFDPEFFARAKNHKVQ